MSNESGHYYTIEGKPCHYVPRADGKGMRSTTIADAKRLGLVPGVTTVLKVLDKPALTAWLVRQSVMAVLTAPDQDGESIDEKVFRVLERDQEQDEERELAAERGKQIHHELELLARGEESDIPGIRNALTPMFRELLERYGKPVLVEHRFAACGYGGTIDLVIGNPDGRRTVVDYKTTSKIPKSPWPEHRLQLAAYAGPAFATRRVSVYISTKNLGEYAIYEHDTPQDEEYKAFCHVLAVWRYMKGWPA